MSITAIWVYSATTVTCNQPIQALDLSWVSPITGTANYPLAVGIYRTAGSASISYDVKVADVQADSGKTLPWPDPPRAAAMMKDLGITQEQVDSFFGGEGNSDQLAG